MKPFLLMAGESYYPESGTGDWIGCFETMEEALAMVQKPPDDGFGHRKYEINKVGYDWYHIVDLRHWMNKP